MQISILGQGFNGDSENGVGAHLIKFLQKDGFHSFIAISAFASEGGVNGLSKYIATAKKKFKSLTVIVGVDEKVTSQEALEAILEMKIKAFVFHEKSFAIFHPKIYLFEGKHHSELIIGSSNLTAKGLFANVETSLLISLDNTKEEDRKVVNDLKDYYKGLFDRKDPNLKKLTKKLIEELKKMGLLPTEADRKLFRENLAKTNTKETEALAEKIFPKRAVAKIPAEFRSKKKAKQVAKSGSEPVLSADRGKLAWTRKELPASSVQASPGGNPTGGLRLVQAKFRADGEVIDQTSYFRNVLFGSYDWQTVKTTPFVEVASVPFEIVIGGKSHGRFDLEVRHKPSGVAGQGNYATSISWGAVSKEVEVPSLQGKRMDFIDLLRHDQLHRF